MCKNRFFERKIERCKLDNKYKKSEFVIIDIKIVRYGK